jgi:hypothetical protein
VSITKTNLLIALLEKSVFGETDTKPVNISTLCLQNADFFSIVPDDRLSSHYNLQQRKPVRLTRPRSCS